MSFLYDPGTRPSEFEIQARLYNKLREEGFNVRGELNAKLSHDRNCRLDLVVYDYNNNPVCIIEVKSWAKPRSIRRYSNKQLKRYRKLGYPVLLCCHKNMMSAVIQEVKDIMFNQHLQLDKKKEKEGGL